MTNLWTVLPPLLSENFGFAEVLEHSDGCGVVDDSGDYRLSSNRESRAKAEGVMGYRGHGEHGRRDKERNRGKNRHGGKAGLRTVVSGVKETDVVSGTREKLLEAFRNGYERLAPTFALFCAGPCGAMIGTNLEEIAQTVSQQYGIPAAAVDITGHKTYDVGISKTTEAMAKLLPDDAEPIQGTVNILGATRHDWAEADVNAVRGWISGCGFQVLSQPGENVTRQELARMGSAQYNLVASVSGLAAAKALRTRFGTPYICMAPFGADAMQSLQSGMPAKKPDGLRAETLIIGEQFTANAVRACLERKGITADVASFFMMEKTCAREGDRRIRGEEDARNLLNDGPYRCIIADPLLRPLLKQNWKWIDLPHNAFHLYENMPSISLLGENLDNWLEVNL